MLLSLEGEEAVGKTTLACTAPLKVVSFSFDMGAQRALFGAKAELFEGLKIAMVPYKATSGKVLCEDCDIVVYELPRPIQVDNIRVKGCVDLWAYFLKLFVEAMQEPTVRSIVVDTMTVARRVRVDAHLESLQDAAKPNEKMRERLLQIEYGTPNDAIRDLWNLGQSVGKNLIGVHHLTDEYADHINSKGDREQVITGNRVLEGLKGTYRFVDISMRMEKKDKGIVAKLNKCGYNLALEGTALPNPTWDSVVDLISMSLGGRLDLERRNPRPEEESGD